jgi:NAD(P)-dependent dehydrogenase (short-subunit alcohol dehydrogenase family)
MKEFKNKVAIISGAASGIGRGIAERCAQEGMKVVLADIVFNAIRNEQFYILTDSVWNADIQKRMENNLQQPNPA